MKNAGFELATRYRTPHGDGRATRENKESVAAHDRITEASEALRAAQETHAGAATRTTKMIDTLKGNGQLLVQWNTDPVCIINKTLPLFLFL